MKTQICDICLEEYGRTDGKPIPYHCGNNGENIVYVCFSCIDKGRDAAGFSCIICGKNHSLFHGSENFTKVASGKFVCDTAECRDAYDNTLRIKNPKLDIIHSTPQSDFVLTLQKAKARRKVKWPSRDINW